MSLPLVADGYGLDRALAAMFWHAEHGETVSFMAALDERANRRAGCWMCWFLGWAVERGHCALALASGDLPTARPAAYRAGFWLLMLLVSIWAVPLLAWHLLRLALTAL